MSAGNDVEVKISSVNLNDTGNQIVRLPKYFVYGVIVALGELFFSAISSLVPFGLI